MAEFNANARVPTRPLSYENVAMAYRKEFIVDYHTGLLYICDVDGNIIDVTAAIYNALLQNGDIGKGDNITIVIPNPENPPEDPSKPDPDDTDHWIIVNLQAKLLEILQDLDIIKNNLKEINNLITKIIKKDENGKPVKDENGDYIPEIPAPYIVQDATHRFLTDIQINNLQKKVEIIERIVSIQPSDVTGTVAPLSCTKPCTGVDPSYPSPHIYVSYTGDSIDSNDTEDSYFNNIQRVFINSANQLTITFRAKPAGPFNMKVQIFKPGF